MASRTTKLTLELRDALASGNSVVVVGAGVSQAATGEAALGWDGLLQAGIQWCEDHVALPSDWASVVSQVLALGDVSSMLAAAQMVTDKMGGRESGVYRQFLYESFNDVKIADSTLIHAIADLQSRWRRPTTTIL